MYKTKSPSAAIVPVPDFSQFAHLQNTGLKVWQLCVCCHAALPSLTTSHEEVTTNCRSWKWRFAKISQFTSAFTFKNLLRHYAKHVSKHGKYRHEIGMLMQRSWLRMTRGFVFSKDCETLRRFVIDDSSCAELHWVARLVTAWQTLKCRAAAYLLLPQTLMWGLGSAAPWSIIECFVARHFNGRESELLLEQEFENGPSIQVSRYQFMIL